MESLYVAVFTARRILRYRRIAIIWGFCHPTIGYAIIIGYRSSILDRCSCARHDGRRCHDEWWLWRADQCQRWPIMTDGPRIVRKSQFPIRMTILWSSWLWHDLFYRLLLRNVHRRNSQPVSVKCARRKAKNEAEVEEKNGSRWNGKENAVAIGIELGLGNK